MRDGWTTYRFDEVFDLQMGKTPDRKTPEYFGGENIWVSIRDLDDKYLSKSNSSKSVIFSPKPIKRTGKPSSSLIARMMPPLEVPSIFVITIPVNGTQSLNSLAWTTPF